MKKMKKRPNIIVLSIVAVTVLLAVGVGLYFGLPLVGPLLKMHPTETGPIPDSDPARPVTALRCNRGTMYFVDTSEGYIMIDAGSSAKKVKASMEELGIDPAQVKWILLTHSDYDHVAALPLFPDADIYMGKGELRLLDGAVKRNRSGGNTLPDGVDLAAIQLVSDGDLLLFGGVTYVHCIAVPGHTPGSMAYTVDDTCIFTGDALTSDPGKIHPFTMDEKEAKLSLIRLEPYASFTAYTSHYGILPKTEEPPAEE